MLRPPWIFIFLIVLTCCIRPHYERQYVDIPCEWRLEADEGSTLCNFRWWEQFCDPVLNQYILIALANNLDLKVAISRVYEYYAKLGIATSGLFPQVEAQASYYRAQSSNALPFSAVDTSEIIPTNTSGVTPSVPGFNRINNIFELFFNLSWELDVWGRISSAVEAACYEWLGQIEARRAFVIMLVTSVANAYITLRQYDSQLDIAKQTLESRFQSLRLAQSRFELGETSELEVVQAQSELETAAISVLQFERSIPQQENLLSVLLGQNPHDIERGRTIESFCYPHQIPAGLPSDLLLRRPDIVEAEDNLIAANARVTEAKALFFPQITLTALYGSVSSQLSTFLTSAAEIWQYGITVVQTIFDAGRTVYRVKEAQAIRDGAYYNYLSVILNAFAEVNDALVAKRMNQKLVFEHQKQVKVLRTYLHLAKLRYQEGEIDYLNVLDAERTLFDAQLALAQAYADNFSAVVQLYGALGGGWVIDADTTAINQLNCEE